MREGSPGEHEVYGGESHVEIVVEVCECAVEFLADFFALEGATGLEVGCQFLFFHHQKNTKSDTHRIDSEFSHSLGNINNPFLPLEENRIGSISLCLSSDKLNIRPQSLSGKTKLDKLLLFHEFGVGTIVNHILAKHRCGQWTVNLLCIDILEFAIEDEIIAFGA